MDNPKLFVSYSWTNPAHEEWVLNLSTELRESGVDVILDKWDLKEGNDANAFMERMVTDDSVEKVIIVCDSAYSEKADKRAGGVGTETQIISAEIYGRVNQNKFVAVIADRDGNGKVKLPTFYKSRIYIDLSDQDLYATNFEQLLRWVYNKPFNLKPELGTRPAFLDEGEGRSLGTSTLFRRSIDAIRNTKPYAIGVLSEYFTTFSSNIERFRLEPSGGKDDFDDDVMESVRSFLPYRNEAIEVFLSISHYSYQIQVGEKLHEFFESLIPYTNRPEHVQSYHEWDWDNLRYIVQELFLYCTSALLKNGRFDLLSYLTQNRYYVARDADYGRNAMRCFGLFRNHLKSMEHRNHRLKLNRKSVHADMIKEFSNGVGIPFNQIMQADFFLFLTDSIRTVDDEKGQHWWPETQIYGSFGGGIYELFSRAESSKYFDKLKIALGINSKKDLQAVVEAFKSGKLHTANISPVTLMNYEKLCTRP